MSKRLNLKMAAGALACVLASGSALFGFLAVNTGSVAQARPAHQANPDPAGLDHFLCYQATSMAGVPGFNIPPTVKLKNQFSSSSFVATFGQVVRHCNPALKIVTTPAGQQTFPPQSPSWHLLCFAITGRQVPSSHVVQVSDQFGQGQLQTGPPQRFCLPSLKSLQTPPVFNPPGPTEIQPDHFTCYPAKLLSGSFTPPGQVQVGDQFDNFQPISVQVGPPNSICLPTKKIIITSSGQKIVTKITNAVAHLLCFNVTQTPLFTGTVWDQNQFGTGALTVTKTVSLCVPSFKTLIH